MNLRDHFPRNASRLRSGVTAGFTMIETMVAAGIMMLVLAGAVSFIYFSAIAVSGVTAQTVINQRAGNVIEFIQSRIRFATSISNDVTGNILTLGFDDNYAVDSDGDKITYDDKDHYERFQFISNNSTNALNCSTNTLVYYPNINSSTNQTLISAGVRNLPGYKNFIVTNSVIVIVRFGVVDNYSRDHYQAIDIQGTGVSLNRVRTNNILSIIQTP